MNDLYVVPDGLKEIESEIPLAINLIAKTARWVHPDTFKLLPIWYPEVARGQQSYNAAWTTRSISPTRKVSRTEANILAAKSLVAALGTRKTNNWTVCHIWGYDDPTFAKAGAVVRDPRFYSCVGNMIWLPTPLKGFTDAVPEIKTMLRVCAFHLYGWACEHQDVAEAASIVRSGKIPTGYPETWPTKERSMLPPGTAPHTARVIAAIEKRKREIRRSLETPSMIHFPRDQVLEVMKFWGVTL